MVIVITYLWHCIDAKAKKKTQPTITDPVGFISGEPVK